MKCIILYLSLFILSSCVTNKDMVLYGEYESKKYNAFQDFYMFKIAKVTYIMGTKLYLNKDSTFIEKNCGNTGTGKWYLQNDTIIMEFYTNRYNNDSLHKANGSLKLGRKGPLYKVVDNHLVHLQNFDFMGKKIVHRLVKVK
jgi:hypothetical protein